MVYIKTMNFISPYGERNSTCLPYASSYSSQDTVHLHPMLRSSIAPHYAMPLTWMLDNACKKTESDRLKRKVRAKILRSMMRRVKREYECELLGPGVRKALGSDTRRRSRQYSEI